MPISEERRKLLAKIHIATAVAKVCSECGAVVFTRSFCPVCGNVYLRRMTEIDYRRFLKKVTGKTSCKFMEDWELKKVMSKIYRYGYDPMMGFSAEVERTREKMIYMIEKMAKERLGSNWLKRLDGFLKKRIKKSIDKCNMSELRKIFAFLRTQEVSQ